MTRPSHILSLVLALACAVPAADADDYWNQFRGPRGDGTSTATDLPTTFSDDTSTWKTPLPGRAWSSPVVWGPQVWVTNAPELQNPPGSSARNADQGDRTPLQKPIRLSAMCLDLETGAIERDITVFEVSQPQFTHETNSYASPTARSGLFPHRRGQLAHPDL